MKIAVLSDIHDNVWKLDAALAAVKEADELVCCGDLCAPFIVHQMARAFARPIHIVFGNNDGDTFRIASNARLYPNVSIHGELFRGEFAGKKVAANHYNTIGRTLAASGEFDAVFFGHNHVYSVERIGRTLAINPGALMGATFDGQGNRTDIASSFAVYDVAADLARGYVIGRDFTLAEK